MLRTEDEARKCWCPFVKLHMNPNTEARGFAVSSRGNVMMEDEDRDDVSISRCLASGCMAWREGPERNWIVAEGRFAAIGEAVSVKTNPENGEIIEGQIERRQFPWGFCGLIERKRADDA